MKVVFIICAYALIGVQCGLLDGLAESNKDKEEEHGALTKVAIVIDDGTKKLVEAVGDALHLKKKGKDQPKVVDNTQIDGKNIPTTTTDKTNAEVTKPNEVDKKIDSTGVNKDVETKVKPDSDLKNATEHIKPTADVKECIANNTCTDEAKTTEPVKV